jgi:histone H3/H4
MSPKNFANYLLQIAIAQMTQTIGFQAIQSTALDILVEVIERYIELISRTARDFCENDNRTEPNVEDLAYSFIRNKIKISELEEYIKWVDIPDFALQLKTQQQQQSSLALTYKSHDRLKQCHDEGNSELLDRLSDEENEHIYDFYPLMSKYTPSSPLISKGYLFLTFFHKF